MSARRKSLLWSTSGAVAPTVALSLFGLIAAGGIAFDYARMAGMDTELQSAADQAALAAASQLDGTSTAITRATSAAQTLIVNQTRFANDGAAAGRAVTVPTLTFYSSYNQDTDLGSATTDPEEAKFVQVSVGTREAVYALTPVVQLFRSGSIGALAVAGVGSAVCRVPPMMLCIPPENASAFPTSSDIGRGLRLQPGAVNDFLVPGNWGYLRLGKGGASELAQRLGQNNQAGGCDDTSEGIYTEPGDKASVPVYLNTRFDLYKNGNSICDPKNGDYCPAENVGKDFSREEEIVISVKKGEVAPANPGCGNTSAKVSDFAQNSSAKGFTRDTCHISDNCPGANLGNGIWDIAGYFSANHPGEAVPSGESATRYSIYKWELQNKNVLLTKRLVGAEVSSKEKGANVEYTFKNQCSYSQPVIASAVATGLSQKDRRVLTVAGVDCSGMKGGFQRVSVKKWIDVFLVEPSEKRTYPYATSQDQIYAEIIGPATEPDGDYAFQYYGRNRPYLLK